MPKPTRTVLKLGIFLLITTQGCAHRREAYYPGDFGPGRGVHVRAPFVDVRVRGKPRLENEPKLVGYDDEREEKVTKKRERDEDRD